MKLYFVKIIIFILFLGALFNCTINNSKGSTNKAPVYTEDIHVIGEQDVDGDGFKYLSRDVVVLGASKPHQFYFKGPESYNSDKTIAYPLVIYLHAWGLTPSTALGGTPGELKDLTDDKASFVYVPGCPPPYDLTIDLPAPDGGEWNSPEALTMVTNTIENLKSRFNIDKKRIYLLGFSMGGAGSFYIGAYYYNTTGNKFTVISRGAGWYNYSDNQYNALAKSIFWIHTGGDDEPPLTMANNSYNWFRSQSGVVELPAEVWISPAVTGTPGLLKLNNYWDGTGLIADVKTLIKNGVIIGRLSVYRDKDHEDLMYYNIGFLDWLFSQQLN